MSKVKGEIQADLERVVINSEMMSVERTDGGDDDDEAIPADSV